MRWFDSAKADFGAKFSAFVSEPRGPAQEIDAAVAKVIESVRREGMDAVIEATRRFDSVDLTPDSLRVSAAQIDAGAAECADEVREAIGFAAGRIAAYHARQRPADARFTDPAGVELGWRWRPLASVGIYVPGGRAAYPSTVLMNAIPARVAGVERIAMASPPADWSPPSSPPPRRPRNRDLAHRRRPGHRRPGPGGRAAGEGRQDRSGRAMPMSPPPSAASLALSASIPWPGPRRSWSWPTPPTIRLDRRRPALAGRTRPRRPVDPDHRRRRLRQLVVAALESQLAALATREVAGAAWREHGAVVIAPWPAPRRSSTSSPPSMWNSPPTIPKPWPIRFATPGHLPGPLRARGAGRLHRRLQPCPAHQRRGPLFLGPLAAGLLEANLDSQDRRRRLRRPRRTHARPGPRRRSAGPRPFGDHPRQRPSLTGNGSPSGPWRGQRQKRAFLAVQLAPARQGFGGSGVGLLVNGLQ